MKQIIKMKDLYSSELYTRSKAAELKSAIQEVADEVELDFSGISFMSRSFADEIYNVRELNKEKSFTYTNRNDVVETMMLKVEEGRSRERQRGFSNPKIIEFSDMESLEKFLLTF